jgi:hypothetical protein
LPCRRRFRSSVPGSSPVQERAFVAVKAALTALPILAHFDPELDTALQVDDILRFYSSFSAHVAGVREILTAAQNAGITLNEKKFHFA